MVHKNSTSRHIHNHATLRSLWHNLYKFLESYNCHHCYNFDNFEAAHLEYTVNRTGTQQQTRLVYYCALKGNFFFCEVEEQDWKKLVSVVSRIPDKALFVKQMTWKIATKKQTIANSHVFDTSGASKSLAHVSSCMRTFRPRVRVFGPGSLRKYIKMS